MAYQNVGTPRFYINVLEWLESNNSLEQQAPDYIGENLSSQIRTLPVNPLPYEQDDMGWFALPYGLFQMNPSNRFVAVLGHNMKTAQSQYGIQLKTSTQNISLSPLINSSIVSSNEIAPDYNGFSITKINDDIGEPFAFKIYEYSPIIGSIIIGTYFDMSHSPDLSLTLTREYGGIKTIETKGGASLSNAFYTKPPKWGGLGAWELGSSNPALSRSGRRVWDLSFSYLQDSDVFAPTELQGAIIFDKDGYVSGTDYATGTNYWMENMRFLAHDDFYSQVIHKTNGGQLPFIFQPDKDNNNPDQFAICKLDMKEFKFEQVANGVYNVKLKIREVW